MRFKADTGLAERGLIGQPHGYAAAPKCNFCRLCGSLSLGGRDAGQILISEGLAHPYILRRHELPAAAPLVQRRLAGGQIKRPLGYVQRPTGLKIAWS